MRNSKSAGMEQVFSFPCFLDYKWEPSLHEAADIYNEYNWPIVEPTLKLGK